MAGKIKLDYLDTIQEAIKKNRDEKESYHSAPMPSCFAKAENPGSQEKAEE